MPAPEPESVLCFATKGAGTNEERRILELLAGVQPACYPFDRADKAGNVLRLLREVRRRRPALLIMEGTGTAGGLVLLIARYMFGVPFVVSSGDAVGPFLGGTRRWAALPGWVYEWLLYRCSAGFIGWTPYLAGRAMTMGAPRAMTAANFTLHEEVLEDRAALRARLGIAPGALVLGIVGNLSYNERRGYCYGQELVQALRRTMRRDLAVLVVGGGSGLDRLAEMAGDDLGHRVFLPGPVPHAEVTSYLAAMDVGSLPQSTDQVGSFRYTTKISEYATARLPFVTGQIPMAYDLVDEWTWRLPGHAPWSPEYVEALAALMEGLDGAAVDAVRARVPAELEVFDLASQRRRVAAFIGDLVADHGA